MGIINRNTIFLFFFVFKTPWFRGILTVFFGVLTIITVILLIVTRLFHVLPMSIRLYDQAIPFAAIALACLCALSFYSINHSVTWIFLLFTVAGIILMKAVGLHDPVPLWRQSLPIITIVFGVLFVFCMISVLVSQVEQ